jgi:hypothetical protein
VISEEASIDMCQYMSIHRRQTPPEISEVTCARGTVFTD